MQSVICKNGIGMVKRRKSDSETLIKVWFLHQRNTIFVFDVDWKTTKRDGNEDLIKKAQKQIVVSGFQFSSSLVQYSSCCAHEVNLKGKEQKS